MQDWVKIDDGRPPANALVVFYVPLARYIWCSGVDYDQVKAEYSTATHWKVVTEEPKSV